MKITWSILLFFCTLATSAQQYNSGIKEGNEAFKNQKFDEAEVNYKKATTEK